MAVNLEFENNLWAMADKLRGNIQPGDYKDVVLGLIFLKYISDSFEEKFNELVEEGDGFEEDRDAYVEDNIFFVPPSARWEFIKKSAKQSTIVFLANLLTDFVTMRSILPSKASLIICLNPSRFLVLVPDRPSSV